MVMRAVIGVVADSQVAAAGGGSTITGDALLNTSVTSYIDFDDATISGGNPQDQTGNGHHLTNNGGTSGATGILNEAFSLDGINDYFNTSKAFLDTTGDFTLSFWLKYTNTGTMTLWDKGGGTAAARMAINLNQDETGSADTGNIRFITNDGTGYNFAPSTSPSLHDGDFHMITLVRDTTSTTASKIYIDGSVVATTGAFATGGNLNDQTDWWIGQALNESNSTSCTIDEMYCRADLTTATGVSNLYNSGEPLPYD